MKTEPTPRRFTYADYLKGPEGRCDELIDGVYWVREPPPSLCHQEFVGEIYHQVRLQIEDRSPRAFLAPFDVRLPRSHEPDEQIDTVLQPDVVVVCDDTKVDKRGVRGPPDWIVEVLSPSTARYDRKTKIPIYERAGVREAWLIQPTGRTVAVYRLKDGHYGDPEVLKLKGSTNVGAVPGVRIDWDRLLARIT